MQATVWYHLQRAESKDFENDEEEDSAADCREANNKSTIKYSSLKILYNKLFGTMPADEFCELEIFALALSVFSRLADSDLPNLPGLYQGPRNNLCNYLHESKGHRDRINVVAVPQLWRILALY
ncbi:unnamed protein product [Gongylonema pulchrum]|uniref:Uncharacterized protein n=1 Tax=Gongylonema pulchrum TaxID=637853 RepID=A0A3P7NML5_9BILA|nr:unnamed protein product [Gongylonema pulchrum]